MDTSIKGLLNALKGAIGSRLEESKPGFSKEEISKLEAFLSKRMFYSDGFAGWAARSYDKLAIAETAEERELVALSIFRESLDQARESIDAARMILETHDIIMGFPDLVIEMWGVVTGEEE